MIICHWAINYITIYHSKQLQEGLMVFSDDFLHFLKIKKRFVEFTKTILFNWEFTWMRIDAKPPWFSGRLPENCLISVWIAAQISMPPWFLDWLLPLNCTHLIETSLILKPILPESLLKWLASFVVSLVKQTVCYGVFANQITNMFIWSWWLHFLRIDSW